jgi:hypothetical protein
MTAATHSVIQGATLALGTYADLLALPMGTGLVISSDGLPPLPLMPNQSGTIGDWITGNPNLSITDFPSLATAMTIVADWGTQSNQH